MDPKIVLETKNLKKYYKNVHAVEDISLNIHSGEIFGFLGPNGAGKTTTIGMILGLIHPTAGSIKIFDQKVTPENNGVLNRVGTLVGAPAMMMSYSARDNLHMLSYLYPEATPKRIDEVLDIVGLKDINKRPVKQFSTGMKQRLGLALALLPKPDLLILDEPTNGMDPVGMHEIRVLLRSLAEKGTTIFISSHLLHEMQEMCDRVAIVLKGSIAVEGKMSDLLNTTTATTTRVKTADPEKAAAFCREIPGNGTTPIIQIQGPYIDIQGIAAEQAVETLVGHGLTPSEVFPLQTNLENIFLQFAQTSNERN